MTEDNMDIWTCGMCGNDFPITTDPNRIYVGNIHAHVNLICDSCDQLGDEGT